MVAHPVVPLAVHVLVPARPPQEVDDPLAPPDIVERARGGAALGQHTHGIWFLPRRGPFERRRVRRRPPLPLLRLAGCIRPERTAERLGIAIEDVAHAIGAVERNRIENVDVRFEDADGQLAARDRQVGAEVGAVAATLADAGGEEGLDGRPPLVVGWDIVERGDKRRLGNRAMPLDFTAARPVAGVGQRQLEDVETADGLAGAVTQQGLV